MKKMTIILLAILALTMGSCGVGHRKLLKSNDQEAKYAIAVAAYEKGDYYKSSQLFESLLLYYRGPGKGETVNLYYAKSLMGIKDFYLAGYQFRSFVRLFPYSPHLEEALYLGAYCKYLESPPYTLDQTITKESLKEFNQYLERYPDSERVPKIQELVAEMEAKLLLKEYEIAYSYYKVREYQAAQSAFKLFLHEYPDNPYVVSSMFYIIKSGYELANKSVTEKQHERYLQVIEDYRKYSPLITDGKYIQELNSIYEKTIAKVK